MSGILASQNFLNILHFTTGLYVHSKHVNPAPSHSLPFLFPVVGILPKAIHMPVGRYSIVELHLQPSSNISQFENELINLNFSCLFILQLKNVICFHTLIIALQYPFISTRMATEYF